MDPAAEIRSSQSRPPVACDLNGGWGRRPGRGEGREAGGSVSSELLGL